MSKFKVGDTVKTDFGPGEIKEVSTADLFRVWGYGFIGTFAEGELTLIQSSPDNLPSGSANRVLTLPDETPDIGMFGFVEDEMTESILPLKCECGSAAIGVDKHSDWCPKFEKNSR